MFLETVGKQFLAAVGLEPALHRVTQQHWQQFYYEKLLECRRDTQHKRGRLLLANPLDYRAVRALDHELEEISTLMRAIELEQSFR